MSLGVEVASIIFSPGASSYNIDVDFFLTGSGVVNNSGVAQNVATDRGFGFAGTATAGDKMVYTSNDNGGGVFQDVSSAGAAIFINNGGSPGTFGATLDFLQHSSAANSTIINNGLPSGENGGGTFFGDSASAGSSTITASFGAYMQFDEDSTAASATLVNDGGTIYFRGRSQAEMAQVRLSEGGVLDCSGHANQPLTLGSLEGDGVVEVSTLRLLIGSKGLDTTFSGVIEEVGNPRNTTSLSKVGSGTLTLSGINTYTDGTTVEEGTLLVKTNQGSATGSGPVQVNAGTFGGRSKIAGAVTIGSGSGTGAHLAPGIKGAGVLVICNTLTFKADGAYDCDLNITRSKADRIVCKGVTIESGAQFALTARGNQTLPIGTVFILIENKTHQHISGVFANLPGHSTFSVNGNTFQVSYEGGDGNDLALTVVP